MLKIHEFADLCQTTTKTLRFYDQKGLLQADYVSPITGYRYYKTETARVFLQIEMLKRAGLSLVQIKTKLQQNDATMITECLDEQIRSCEEKIELCKMLKDVYMREAQAIDILVTPQINADAVATNLIVSQGVTSFRTTCADISAAELCAEMLRKGSRRDIFIVYDFADIQAILADRHITGSHKFTVSNHKLEESDRNAFQKLASSAQCILGFITLSVDTNGDDAFRLLDSLVDIFDKDDRYIWACKIDDIPQSEICIITVK
jgi:DNA-binding transcriptional MerR regulator